MVLRVLESLALRDLSDEHLDGHNTPLRSGRLGGFTSQRATATHRFNRHNRKIIVVIILSAKPHVITRWDRKQVGIRTALRALKSSQALPELPGRPPGRSDWLLQDRPV